MVNFESVKKSFNHQVAVDSVSLRLESQKIHVLLGQSGSGKSTLIRIAAGLLTPDSGRVLLNNKIASDIGSSSRAKIFGFMIQEGGLFPHLTCRQNVILPAQVHGSDFDIESRFKELSEITGLSSDIFSRYPRQVSGGQRQRVALMRSLFLDPPIVFLDEPLGALDPLVRSDLQKELKTIFRKLKKTVILVTHDLAEAAFFADTLTLLRDGQVEQHGVLNEFLSNPKTEFVTAYFNAQKPPPNLL